jgi:predicted alpha/beta superfamily hydrolase
MKTALAAGGLSVSLYLPEGETEKLIYLIPPEDGADGIWALSARPGLALASIDGADYFRDMTPWKAKKYPGGGADFLNRLAGEIIPAVEGLVPDGYARGIAGYSLAGLFALWAACETELFQLAASASGSFWYPGWTDYVSSHRINARRVYLSLGTDENGRGEFAGNEEKTELTRQIAAGYGAETVFEHNPGNHFADVDARTARGIIWL